MSETRNKLKQQYKELYQEVEAILFKHDLMGVNFEDNTDEYDPEVDTILPRLKDAKNMEDVATIIHEEFSRWFDKDMAGNKNHPAYKAMAAEVWAAWIKHSRPLA
jgi:phage terminase small subunit